MRRIPKAFQLLGHTYTVRIVSARDWDALCDEVEDMDEDDVGYFIPAKNLIVIKRQIRTQMLHTFYHELMHAIYFNMHINLPHDEQHVDQAGGLLAQAMDTAK
jgi:hypothetical protein